MIDARNVLVRLRDRTLCFPEGAALPFRIRIEPARSERGSVAVIFTLSLLLIFGFFGLAIDLSRLYNTRIEMQTVADAVALAAARELNGTSQGITKAVDRANEAATKIKYYYDKKTISWSPSAIKFGTAFAPEGTWLESGSAAINPARFLYVKVDMNDLPSLPAKIETLFMRVLPSSAPTSASTTVSAGGRAIAGPSMIDVTPFAICAKSTIPRDSTPNLELREYGFRRGMGYDLNATPTETFRVYPVAPPGTSGSTNDMTEAAVTPFLCAGTMAMLRVTGGPITVASPFPLTSLFDRFNSRFDNFSTANCYASAAPPDTNVRSYDRTAGTNIPWMSTVPAGSPQVAQSTTDTAAQYGVLWSFAKAAKYAPSEPAGGDATFKTNDWNTLYPVKTGPALTATGSYNTTSTNTPYLVANSLKPRVANWNGTKFRRVLNVPLLSCPVGGSSATVLAIGKFFMTVPATASHLYAEFAGLAPETSLASKLELHP